MAKKSANKKNFILSLIRFMRFEEVVDPRDLYSWTDLSSMRVEVYILWAIDRIRRYLIDKFV